MDTIQTYRKIEQYRLKQEVKTPKEWNLNVPDGTTKMITRTTVCAVYDKSSHSLQLLKHPIENTLGLYNDIDDGPLFSYSIFPHLEK